MTPTLVVGGEASFVQRRLSGQLSRHGLEITDNWPWDKVHGAIPKNVEVVFMLTDMTSHALTEAAAKNARGSGKTVILGTRKYALNIDRLTKAGFPAISTTENEDMSSNRPFKLNVLHAGRAKHLRGSARDLYEQFLPMLAIAPGLSNKHLSERTNKPYGTVGEPARCARETMGLRDEDGGGHHVLIDRNIYEKNCAILGLPPIQGVRISKGEALDVAARKEDLNPKEQAAPPPPPPPSPPAPIRFEPSAVSDVNAPPPAPRDALADIRSLVEMLRAEMASRNISRMVITPTGVDVTRVVVIDESLGF